MTKKIDIIFLSSIVGLCVAGLLFIYSASLDITGSLISSEFQRQLIFFILGLAIFVAIQFIPLNYIIENSIIIYGICILLLILTLLFGEVRNGAKSWLGILSFGIQASEFMKVASMLFLSSLLAEYKPNLNNNLVQFVKYGIIILLPMILILLQPDMGTALVFIPIALVIYFIHGVSGFKILFFIGSAFVANITLIISYQVNSLDFQDQTQLVLLRSTIYVAYLGTLLVICVLSVIGIYTGFWKRMFQFLWYGAGMFLCGGVLSYAAARVLKPYQLRRLLVFVNPESDPLGSGWHILRSKTTIGSGGMFGQGFLNGTQTKLEFLPQKTTDFIFSVIGEELGLVGSVIILILYTILLWRIILIGMNSKNEFSRLYCSGVNAMFVTHFVVNIGMTLGIMPITGIPLLLISYGGSSLWNSMIALALVHSIYIKNNYKSNPIR